MAGPIYKRPGSRDRSLRLLGYWYLKCGFCARCGAGWPLRLPVPLAGAGAKGAHLLSKGARAHLPTLILGELYY